MVIEAMAATMIIMPAAVPKTPIKERSLLLVISLRLYWVENPSLDQKGSFSSTVFFPDFGAAGRRLAAGWTFMTFLQLR